MDQAPFAEARLGITAAATNGDAGLLYRLVARLLDQGVAFDTVLFDVLLRSEGEVGSRWQAGDYLVSEEHAATATFETVIALLAGSLEQPEGAPHVVVATAEGDHHSLPARAVAANLLYHGFRTTFLGANVLSSDLRLFLESESPDALVLSCAMSNHLLGARAAVRESHAVAVPVLVGGRGFGPHGIWAAPTGADSWAGSGKDAPRILESWSPDVTLAEGHARDPDGSLLQVIDQRNRILAVAEDQLTTRADSPNGRLREEVRLALGAVEASMLVSDWTLLDDFLAWQRRVLEAHELGGGEHIAGSLATALGPIDPEAAERVAVAARG